jgi:hypothetical protein
LEHFYKSTKEQRTKVHHYRSFRDIMHCSDANTMIQSTARELYELNTLVYRVLVCVCPEDNALKVVEYNDCTMIRWCFSLVGTRTNDNQTLFLASIFCNHGLSPYP